MKKISERLKVITETMFSDGNDSAGFWSANMSSNYSRNNIFSKFLRVKVSSGTFEIPLFLGYYIEKNIINQLITKGRVDDIVVYLGEDRKVQTVSTINQAFNSIHHSVTQAQGFYSYKTPKSDVYHIDKGVIFDKDMKLLMFNTIEVEIKEGKIEYKKPKSYIHPSVFYSDGLVEKAIVEKMIPYILSEGTYIYGNLSSDALINPLGLEKISNNRYIRHKISPEIIVKDVKDIFFCTPNMPSENYNEDINNMLVREADLITSIIG